MTVSNSYLFWINTCPCYVLFVIGHVQYIKILTWLQGFWGKHLYIFVAVFWYSSVFWKLRDIFRSFKKNTILTWKPYSHVRILIYLVLVWFNSKEAWGYSKAPPARDTLLLISFPALLDPLLSELRYMYWFWDLVLNLMILVFLAFNSNPMKLAMACNLLDFSCI